MGSYAVQLLPLHLFLPPHHTDRLLPIHRTRPRSRRFGLADPRFPVLLRMVEPRLRLPSGRIHCVQLLDRGPDGKSSESRPCRPQRFAHPGHRLEPRPARIFQIRQLFRRHLERRFRCRDRSGADPPAAGDFVFHLPADHVPGRLLQRPRGVARLRSLLFIRFVLPAAHRRTHRALLGNAAAIRQRTAKRIQSRKLFRRHHAVPFRLIQKGGDRRRHGPVCTSLV